MTNLNVYRTFILVLLQIIFGHICILLTTFNEYIHNYVVMHIKELLFANVIIWTCTIVYIEYINVKTLFSLILYTIFGSFTICVCSAIYEKDNILNMIHSLNIIIICVVMNIYNNNIVYLSCIYTVLIHYIGFYGVILFCCITADIQKYVILKKYNIDMHINAAQYIYLRIHYSMICLLTNFHIVMQ